MEWEDQKIIDFLKAEPEKDYGVRFMEKAETDYKNMSVSAEEKVQRKKTLESRLKKLTFDLSRTKNIKNHKATQLNSKIAAMRSKIKAQITEIKDELYEIQTQQSTNNQISELKPNSSVDKEILSTDKETPTLSTEEETRAKNLEILRQHWHTRDPFE